MIDEIRIRSVLSRMAGEFRDQRQEPAGWGQFLNLPRQHYQIGPYGTAAGAIVLSLDSPGLGLETVDIELLHKFWYDWKAVYNRSGRKFIQNLRLAFYYLAIHLSGHQDMMELGNELSTELLSRQLPNHLWGSWFLSDSDKHGRESIFISAVIILAFSLPRDGSKEIPEDIRHGAVALQERASTDKNLSDLELLSCLAAIVWALPNAEVKDSIKQEIRRRTKNHRITDTPGLYFFDFQYIDHGKRKFGRDYFVVPGGVFESLMIRDSYCHYLDILARERILSHFLEILETHKGNFITRRETLVATVSQAWIALALHIGRLDRVTPIPIRYRLIDWLRKPRPDTIFWRLVLPIGAAIVFISGTLEPRLLTKWLPGQIKQLLVSNAPPAPTIADFQTLGLDGLDWSVKLMMFLMAGMWSVGLYRTVRAKIDSILHRD